MADKILTFDSSEFNTGGNPEPEPEKPKPKPKRKGKAKQAASERESLPVYYRVNEALTGRVVFPIGKISTLVTLDNDAIKILLDRGIISIVEIRSVRDIPRLWRFQDTLIAADFVSVNAVIVATTDTIAQVLSISVARAHMLQIEALADYERIETDNLYR